MNKSLKYFFLLVWLIGTSLCANTVTITGKITDENNTPLSFVTIYVKGTTNGVMSNAEGEYVLEVEQGRIVVVFQLTGYKAHSEELIASKNINLNIQLKEDAFQLKEIVIDQGKEDPAYAIIRSAQKRRAFYLNQVNSFSCDVYIKGLQRIKKYPKKILGREINLDNILDTSSGIAYLSESYSKFFFKKPDKIKETLISSKVSGRNNAFTFNQATDVLFNFYENVMQTGFSQRGLISPIAGSSFLNYKYHFEGSFYENGVWVNKIKVNPKHETDPCFSGFIYICDSTWRIYNLELFVTKQNQIKFVDTLRISQMFLPVTDSVWMPLTTKLSFDFNFLGFNGDGYFHGINSNYILNPVTEKKFFNGEEWKVNENANKKNTAYWDSLRPIPLTDVEERDYHRKDSLNKIWESKPYKDSLDRRANRFKMINFFQGYVYRNSWKQTYIRISPPITGVLFNTVQGLNISTEITFNKRNKETRREFEMNLNPSYGFASQKMYLFSSIYYMFNPKKLASFSISGGRQLSQFNQSNPISPFINTVYSLGDKKNYMKVYSRDFFELKVRREIANGILIRFGAEFSERTQLGNQSFFTWAKRDYEYESNSPQFQSIPEYSFSKNRKTEFSLQIRLRPGQRYYSYPNRKIPIGSKFPEFNIGYNKAIGKVFNSSVEYDAVSISVSDKLDLKRFGKSQFLIRAGKYFNQKNMSFMDYKHFNGNQTMISNFNLEKFELLPYYSYSINDAYIEGWFEHNFSGLIMSKIPLIKKIQIEELINFRYLQLPASRPYFETGVGFKYFLLRTEFVYSPSNLGGQYGFRFGILL